MTTVNSILTRLRTGSVDSVSDYYSEEELAKFAESHKGQWDEETSPDDIVEDFVDSMWNGKKPCRRCSVCGRIMREGYFEPDVPGYYCSDDCLRRAYNPSEYQEAYERGYIFYTEWW